MKNNILDDDVDGIFEWWVNNFRWCEAVGITYFEDFDRKFEIMIKMLENAGY